MKRIAIGGGILVLVLLSLAAMPQRDAMREPGMPDSDQSRIQKGLDISPVPLALHAKNRALAALGSYLVNAVGGCNDCHTCPSYAPGVEHNPYIGGDGMVNADAYLAGGVPFALGPVTIHSANLTPDENGLPEHMTFEGFERTIRTGHDQEDGHILMVMPWPVYRTMTDRDLLAIYTFLTAIPSSETPPGGTCTNAGEATFPPPRAR